METIEVRLDRSLFSEEVLTRTGHRYSSQFYIHIRVDANEIIVRLTQRTAHSSLILLPERFHTDALDERLRERIRVETHDIHQALIQAALREAHPSNISILP